MTNQDLFHGFAHAQKDGAKETNSVFYRNDICYSYGYHFPIAVKVRDHNDNVKFILWNNNSYSNTTAKHQSHLAQALSQYEFINMYTLGRSTPEFTPSKDNRLQWRSVFIEEMKKGLEEAEEAAKAYGRSRLYKDNCLRDIVFEMERIGKIAEEFKLKSKIPHKVKKWFKEEDENKRMALFGIDLEEFETWKAEKEEKLKKASQRAAERRKKQLEESLRKFRNFEIRNFWAGNEFSYLRYDDTVKEVQTSQGVVIEIEEARRILKLIDRKEAVGQVVRDRHRSYEIVKSNGVFKAGCHTIERSEIEAIRPKIENHGS